MKRNLKILAVSDTHGSYYPIENLLKYQGDIFIHAGDFTDYGRQKDFYKFFDFLDKLKFKHKIVIAGNHQIMLDQHINNQVKQQFLIDFPCSKNRDQLLKQLKSRCYYLEHQPIEIEGIKFFGSPWTIYYGGSAFQYGLQRDKEIWSNVPQDTQFLITHSPPYGILDQNRKKLLGGSVALSKMVEQIKPKIHIFGHIHQSRGSKQINGIKYINLAQNPTLLQW